MVDKQHADPDRDSAEVLDDALNCLAYTMVESVYSEVKLNVSLLRVHPLCC